MIKQFKTLIFALFILAVAIPTVFADAPTQTMATHQGPIPPLNGGFGSWGDETLAAPESFQFVSQGYTNTVTIYYPDGQTAPAPTLFFAPGWDVTCNSYAEIFHFWVSLGYVAVCDDYHENSGAIGGQMKDAFAEAVNRYPTRIDTGKIGLMGHSSGGGLLPSVGYDLVKNKGWGGTNGENLFFFSSAPWIDFDITDAMVADYPTGVKWIMHTYEDDNSTDLRTYIELFEDLPIPDSEKDFIIVRPATIDGYNYQAPHRLIATGDGGYGVFDALDDYAVFRLLEALADYTFTGNLTAKNVALGDGSVQQIEMGDLPDLISTDDPRPIPGENADYPCDINDNPRHEYCDDFDDELPASVLISPVKFTPIVTNPPVFRWEPSPTATNYFLQLRPMLDSKNPDWNTSYGENLTATEAGCADIAHDCVFTVTTRLPLGRYVWWILPSNDTHGGVWSRRGYFSAVQYPPDTTYQPITTTTPTMPGYLASIIDTTTSTRIKRITQPDAAHYGSEPPTHSYSKNQPWNADATLYKFYTVAVYNGETHELVQELPGGDLYESFWSNTNPDLLYSFRTDGTIRSYTISTEQTKDLYQLSGYDTVRLGPGEGNIDIHDKFVALAGKRGTDFDVIVFDLQKERIVVTKTFTGAWGAGDLSLAEHIDWASVSQSGDYVVISWDTGAPWDVKPFNGHSGIEVYNAADMTFQRRLVRYGNHGDLCFSPTGEEIYVQFWGDNGTINAYHLDDGQIDVIQSNADFGVGDAHLSCRNILRPGWAYVSTDKSKGGMVVAVKLDTSETIEYFGHHFSSVASYKKSPMPVPAPNGSPVMFKSDFGDDSDPNEAYAFEASFYESRYQVYLPLILR